MAGTGRRRPSWSQAVQVQVLASLATLAANVVGSVATFVYLQLIAPYAPVTTPRGSDLVVSLAVFAAYMAAAIAAGGAVLYRTGAPVRAWLAGDRPPTEDERLRTLQLPGRHALASGLFWLGAAVVFPVLGLLQRQPAVSVARTLVGILFGGLATCGITFVAVERVLRPVVALALAGGERLRTARGLRVRDRILLSWLLGSGLPLLGILLSPVTADRNARGAALLLPVVSLAVVGLVVGFLMAAGTARAIAAPLTRVRSALEAVRDGDLQVSVPVDDGGDIGMVEAGVNQMVVATRERARLQDLFGRHVGAEVADQALAQDVRLGGEEREVSVLFVDVVGSTELAASQSPAEVVRALNDFFGRVVAAASEHGGWVNKFEGDGALCVFGAPVTQPDHATMALRAARRMRQLLGLDGGEPGDGRLDAGIGVSSGLVIAGNVGALDRFEYTVIGDPVNEASRLTEAAKATAGRVLASGATLARAYPYEAARWEPAGTVRLRGRPRPTEAYAPADPHGTGATGAGRDGRAAGATSGA